MALVLHETVSARHRRLVSASTTQEKRIDEDDHVGIESLTGAETVLEVESYVTRCRVNDTAGVVSTSATVKIKLGTAHEIVMQYKGDDIELYRDSTTTTTWYWINNRNASRGKLV